MVIELLMEDIDTIEEVAKELKLDCYETLAVEEEGNVFSILTIKINDIIKVAMEADDT